ncbi:pyruvate kinase isozyme A, chloroplastic [Dorcoceras hygrometricum]|uniref:Pyruvate kinase isozyme A, chloroplastic n=1 Tax=Dorcoceras hygrometricum TaxID=472368 RepID=A0A2Z7BBR8_9LAMI|nr:pyruvate kinase isozyme A, chloroplastic [Dorcoceras hygrometricum]
MFANRTKQTSSKVTVEQSAVGIYESVTRHWNQSQATVNQSEDTLPDARYMNQSQANQSQDTRNTLTLKPVAVNSALLDSNKEGYLLVSNGEGYLLVSRKEGYLLVSRKEGEHCDVLSMQIDSDLVIYRTTLVRTFQVVTICRVDKSEVLVVLISPHDSKRH